MIFSRGYDFILFSTIYHRRPRLTVTFYTRAINAFLGRQIATADVIALAKISGWKLVFATRIGSAIKPTNKLICGAESKSNGETYRTLIKMGSCLKC